MSLAVFEWTNRARPIIEVGIGSAVVTTARWDSARWDDPAARWSGNDPLWLDITCDVRSARCEYGRRATTDRFVPGVATITVDNASGWADPNIGDQPGALTLRPGRAVRISIDHIDRGRTVLFRGFIDEMVPVYAPRESDAVELVCIDALGEVNRGKVAPVTPMVGAGETASERVHRILDVVSWSPAARDVWPSSEPRVETDLGGQVADLLGRTADSAGGAVFGDLEGRVAFRPRDWQSFLPDEPLDGTIGNVDPIGSPAVPPSVVAPGYLTPAAGLVSTPDAPITGPVRFTVRARLDTAVASGYGTLVAQRGSGSTAFAYQLAASSAGLILRQSTDGTTITNTNMGPVTVGAEVTYVADSTVALFNSTAAVVLGARTAAGSDVWPGRIYSAQMEQLDGVGNPTGVVWRFDASDYPGTGTSYVDPRGRTWTLSAPGAITPKVTDPGSPAVAPDVCPVRWERPFARADITTRAIIGRDLETAVVVDDAEGQARYGIEPFERTDLLTLRDDSLLMLANRVLRTRSSSTAPRVRSVSLDARTSDAALDLMTDVKVYKPSRYRCRLEYPAPRGLVFDAEYLATGVAHELTRDAWTLELNLDVAAPFEVAGGRWDGAYWGLASWTDAVALIAEARSLIGALT